MNALVISALLSAFGQQPSCPQDAIKINILPFEVRVDTDQSYAQLQKIGAPAGEAGLLLTTTSVKVDGCTVTAGWKAPVLYVARELRGHRCALRHVLLHERQHLQIYREALATLEERIRAGAADKTLFDAAIGAVTAVHAARAELDTGSRHARNATACGGEISRLIRAGNPG